MKSLLLFFSLIIALQAKSQTQDTASWSPPGATWVYRLGATFALPYIKFKYVGDTLIQNKITKKINSYGFEYIGDNTTIIRRRDAYLDTKYFHYSNDTVYLLTRDTFKTLYVFSAQPRDYWEITETGNYRIDSIYLPMTDTIAVRNITPFNSLDNNWVFDLFQTERTRFWQLGSIVKNIGGQRAFIPIPIDTMRIIDSNIVICYDYGFMAALECYCDDQRGVINLANHWELTQSCAQIIADTSVLIRLGVEKEAHNSSIQLYPNPAVSHIFINIEHSSPILSHNLIIYNSFGQVMSVQKIANQQTVDISHLPTGAYLVLVENPHFAQTFKLVKL